MIGPDAGTASTSTSGRRVVVTLYGIVVAVGAVVGFVLGAIRPKGLDPELFGVVQLPPTPLGMAVYGGVTLAVVLGALLGLVAYVSRFDEEEPVEVDGE